MGLACLVSFLAISPTFSSNLVIVGESDNLRLEPEDEKLFSIQNMYPGKQESSLLGVKNLGEGDFDLSLSAQKAEGDRLLFEGLEVGIESSEPEGMLYQGSMSGVEDIFIGTIEPKPVDQNARLTFTVGLPPGSGNEYQGLSVAVDWVFTAQGAMIIDDDPDDPVVPVRPTPADPPVADPVDPPLEDPVDPPVEDPVVLPEVPEEDPVPGKAALAVYKFMDRDQSGVWAADEEAIADWTIYINEREYSTPVVLDDLEPGEYTVREEEREGWLATHQTEVDITLEEGDSKAVMFGNVPEEKVVLPEVPVEPEPPPVVDARDLVLPATGEVPFYWFYGAGALLLLCGLFLARRHRLRKARP